MGKKSKKSKKDVIIEALEEEIESLEHDIDFLGQRIVEITSSCVKPPPKEDPVTILERFKNRKCKYAGALCFDFWPLSDWKRLSISRWRQGKYFQLAVGPLRLDFWQD